MNDIVIADRLLERLTATREDQTICDSLFIAVGIVAGSQAHNAGTYQAEANWREFCGCEAFW
jgi:hypothetical protein